MSDTQRTEVARLVQRLASRKRSCADSARARLSVIGARAVGGMIEALEGADDRVRARVMPLLAKIQDPRSRAPLTAMLLDHSTRLRCIAAQSLARFSSPDSVCALQRALERETAVQVRESLCRSLVAQFAAGQESALVGLLGRLCDTAEAPRVRLAAFAVLPRIPATEREALLARLREDRQREVRRRAVALAALRPPEAELPQADVVGALVAELACEDYAVWNRAVERLGECGRTAIPALLAEMRRRAHDPEFCTRTGIALKAMESRRGTVLADAMDSIDEPLPLLVLIDVICAVGEKSQIYRLKELIDRIARQRTSTRDAVEPLQAVRAKAHLGLAAVGSRVAIEDLREALLDTEQRPDPDLLTALRAIGQRDEIPLLLRVYSREDETSRREIGETVRAIVRRERIRRNNKVFQKLGREQGVALGEILPRRGPRSPRAPR